jgi:hypothetical protein
MKRPLDLNGSSHIFLKIIVTFILLVPAALYLCGLLLGLAQVDAGIIPQLIGASLIAGGGVIGVWVMLIACEQIQDHLFDANYQRNRQHKLPVSEHIYECQYCGNRRVREDDRTCSVCGRMLEEARKH